MTKAGSYRTGSPEETEALGEEFASGLKPGDIVGLIGGLGGGKTSFTKGVARGLGETGYVKSPSFTILNIYGGGRLPLYHIDLYRISNEREFAGAGLEEYIYAEGISIIEWADRVPGLLEECDYVIRFNYLNETGREILIERR